MYSSTASALASMPGGYVICDAGHPRPRLSPATCSPAGDLLMLMVIGNTQASVAPISMTMFFG
jgi:hypothetical protein